MILETGLGAIWRGVGEVVMRNPPLTVTSAVESIERRIQ